MNLLPLVENESLKIIRRRRFTIIVAILIAILSVVAWSQKRQLERSKSRNWRAEVQQRIAAHENMLRRGRMNPAWANSIRAENRRLQFYLDHEIDPDRPTAPMLVRTFATISGFLLLPLLIAALGSDVVSAESAEGTDKLLLTRPVRRWKILTSKVLALYMFTTLTLLAGAVLAYLISSTLLDPRGWTAPTFTGFQLTGDNLDFKEIRQLPVWRDTIIAYGLEWYAILCVASIALLLSVLFKSSTASMGTMLAMLIGGTIVTRISPDWTAARYFFVSGLPLAAYYSGEPPPYDGMSLAFCMGLLGAWAAGALIVAYVIFMRRDVFG